jgi:hypothetical protein
MTRTARAFLVASAVLLAARCTGSAVEVPDLSGGSIETVLGASVIDVGAKVDVTCSVFNAGGTVIPITTVVRVTPAEGLTVADHSLTGVKVGQYAVACATVDGVLIDQTPASLYVSTNGVRGVETVLKDTTIKAGTTLNVACSLLDADGKPLEGGTEVTVDPMTGVTIQGPEATFTKVGEFGVACRSTEAGLTDDSPAHVTVIPNDPAVVTASPKQPSAKAGESVVVECSIVDAYDNPINDMETTLDEQDGLVMEAHTVTGEVAGDYEITCSVADWEGEYQKVPGPFTVEASEPASVELVVTPKKDHYKLLDKITLSYVVRDQFGNEIQDVPASFTIPDSPGVKELTNPGDVRFMEEGIYEFSVTLDAPWSSLKDSKTLICDVSGPVIDIFFPERGQTFAGDPAIHVKGKVFDEWGEVKKVTINGNDCPLEEDGTFEYVITSTHGANGFMLEATDKFFNESKTSRGWYYSTAYQAAYESKADAPLEEVRIQDGAMVYTGQAFLDDADHDPSHINDVATIFEVVLGSIDFQQLIGMLGPIGFNGINILPLSFDIFGATVGVQGSLDIGVTIDTITIGQPTVSLQCREGGIDMAGAFAPVRFDFSLTFTFHLWAGVEGLVEVELDPPPYAMTESGFGASKLGLTASFDVSKLPGDALHVTAKDFALALEGIDVDLLEGLVISLGGVDLGFLGHIDLPTVDLSDFVGNINDFIGDNVVNPLLNLIIPALNDLLQPVVEMVLGPILEQVVQLLVLDLPLDIPGLIPGMEPISLRFTTELSSVVFHPDGGRLGLGLGMLSDKKVDREPLGSILRDGCMGTDPDPVVWEFEAQPTVQIGARYDFVNQALFAVWWGGTLNMAGLDLGGLLGGGGGGGLPIDLEDLQLSTEFLLPPILDDCGDKGLQEIEVADARLNLKFKFSGKQQDVDIWLQAKALGGVIGLGNEIGIRIDKVAWFQAEIIDNTGGMAALLGLVEGFLPSLLEMVEGQQFTFPVPAIDLSIIPGVPAGSSLQIGNFRAYNKKGVTVIGADLL